jgi:hypothetical protein
MPVSRVLTDNATSTLRIIASLLAPLAASAVAIEEASTLITATAGESGPPTTGENVEVKEITTQVITVPMMRPARPSAKPPARSPVKMRAAKEMQ